MKEISKSIDIGEGGKEKRERKKVRRKRIHLVIRYFNKNELGE